MASVYKPKGRHIYRVEFKDQHGKIKTISSGTDDKRVAENLGAKIEEDADRLRVGMPPKNIDYTGPYLGLVAQRRGRVKWNEATDASLAELERHGSGPGGKHHRDVRVHLKRWAEACGWKTLDEATPAAISHFLGRLQAEGRSPRTQNHYLAHLRQMLAWAVKPQGWLTKNPAAEVDAARVGAAGRRRLRRAYSAEEFRHLLAAAPFSRQIIYQTAAYSGLRRSELRRLEKQDCDPCGPQPRWKLRPEVTKNGVGSRLPMLPECAAALRPTWEALPDPSSKVFRAIPSIELLHRDLAQAGIPRQDGRGRWTDFHSFRYTFCTWMAARHPVQLVQRLMRHGTITLTTDIYNDLDLSDTAEALWTLPPLLESLESGEKSTVA
jgi:integrase